MVDQSCSRDSSNCPLHFHDEDPIYLSEAIPKHVNNDMEAALSSTMTGSVTSREAAKTQNAPPSSAKGDTGFRRIIRNFTPSYV